MRIDHLLLGAPDLERGRAWVADRLGLPTVPGGRHPQWGTHNALGSLGPDTYLEVIAPDPDGEDSGLLGLADLDEPRLVSFAVATDDLPAMAAAAAEVGVDLGDISAGTRETPDGGSVAWEVTDPSAPRLDGVIPFGIDWGDTPHPAAGLPDEGIRLTELIVEHPRPFEARRAVAALGLELLVRDGDAPRLVATLTTPAGDVTLA